MEAARGVVLGFDVGRYSHHMTAIDARTGEVVASRGVEQTEPDIREAIELCFVNLSFHKTASVRFTRQREDSSRTSVALAPILSSPTTPRA